MLGKIKILEYKILCIIGDLECERKQEQEILIDLEVKRDFFVCAKSDNLNDTLDYVSLANSCKRVAVEGKYRLVETCAYEIMLNLFDSHNIAWAKLKIRKPFAFEGGAYAEVELEHFRDNEEI